MTESLTEIDAAIAKINNRRTHIIRQITAATVRPPGPMVLVVQAQAKPVRKGKVIEFPPRN